MQEWSGDLSVGIHLIPARNRATRAIQLCTAREGIETEPSTKEPFLMNRYRRLARRIKRKQRKARKTGRPVILGTQTGAQRHLDRRLEDPEYLKAYIVALEEDHE